MSTVIVRLGTAFVLLALAGCGFIKENYLGMADWPTRDAQLNSWIGKSKDERIMKKGPPESCTTLKSGDEVCAWVMRGYSSSGGNVNCVPGAGCSGGGSSGSSWEHHIMYRYNSEGFAVDWSYWGSWGSRNMGDSKKTDASP